MIGLVVFLLVKFNFMIYVLWFNGFKYFKEFLKLLFKLFFIKCFVILCCGFLNILFIVFCLIILLFFIIVILLYIFCIICILCVISIIVKFCCFFIFNNKFRILFVVCGFNVFVVLLYNNIFGLLVNVFVIFIFCFCLFDNLDGYVFFWFFRLISLMSFNVFCLVRLFGMLVIFNGNVIFFNIFFDYRRLKCWKIIFIFCCFFCNCDLDNWFILLLFIMILFDVGDFKLLNIFISVFLLVFEKLIILKIELDLMFKLMWLIVRIFLFLVW